MTTRLTIVPFLLAFFAAVAAMPTNIFQICAWNAGTLAVDAWRQRSAAAIKGVAQGIRAWLASMWSPRVAFACAAVLLAILFAQHSGSSHDGVMTAVLAPALLARRAQLLREVGELKNSDGSFLNDEARATADAKITEIEDLNRQDTEQSVTIVERDADATPRTPVPAVEPNDRDAGAAAERTRVQGIIAATRAARLPMSFSDGLIKSGALLVDAQAAVLEEMGRRDGGAAGPRPGSGPAHDVRFGDDPLVHVRAGIQNALLHRSAPDRFKLDDVGKRYRGMSLLDIGRAFLKARGAHVMDLSRSELVDAMLVRAGLHSTVDFPGLFEDAANKNLRSAYEAAPQTWREISRLVSLSDFKPSRQLQVGDAPALLEILEHGEYTFGTIGEAKESIQLKTYGRMFGITRQALINDDLNAFSEVPAAFGRKARDIESDLAWAQITGNPTMGDGNALFDATNHANYTASGTAITVTSLGVGRAALRKQKGIDAATLLNLMARYLIVPAALETIADQYLTQITAALSSNVNPFATGSGRTPLTPIVEPRLDANSATAWYMATDQAQAPVLYHGVLDGQEGPLVTQMEGFDVEGMKFRCRIDVAFKAADWRAIYKNVGA